MKKLIIYILLPGIALLSGCKEAEAPFYSDRSDRINFLAVDNSQAIIYPDILAKSVNLKDYEVSGQDGIPIPLMVQVQGYSQRHDQDRKVFFTSKHAEGTMSGLLPAEYTIPAGQDTVTLKVLFAKNGLGSGLESVINVTFDYDKGDFLPGMVERQTYAITCRYLYKPEHMGLTETIWKNMYAGSVFWGFPWPAGYGPWSSQKADFIVKTLDISNFLTELPDVDDSNSATAIGTFEETRDRLTTALEEYKALNAQDPAAYPPLLDEVKNNGSWIAFLEEEE